MKLNYKINNSISLKFAINNLTDNDDVRLVGTPVSRQASLFEINYHID